MLTCNRAFIEHYFNNVVFTYEKTYLLGLLYEKHVISKYEILYNIEDSFLLYVCIETTTMFNEVQYQVKLEELLPNNIFKFIITKFLDMFEDSHYLIFYKKFNGLNNYAQQGLISNNTTWDTINAINKKLPQLNIINRVENWNGFLYHSFFFELTSNQYTTYAICCTQKNGGYSAAYQKCNMLPSVCLYLLYEYKGMSKKNHFYVNGFMFDSHAYIVIEDIFKNPNSYIFYNKVRFWLDHEYIKNCINVKDYQMSKIDKFVNSDLYKTEPFIYQKKPVKWKSEYMLYELTQKIYGPDNVVFQYAPYFLKTDGHSLSYDIFIPKKRIAIEYQGKQHFEPIDYFGGQAAFNRQVERDERKRALSLKNNVNLIYIYYWEDLTIDNLKHKILSATKNK